MLHKAAQFVVKELAGSMPRTAAGLRTLPGIGEYTSAAIASIAFGEAAAVVDGNVERVVTRLAALEQEPGAKPSLLARAIRQTADDLLDRERPGDFNQALMELGATVCLPKNPLCLQCPVQQLCRTRGEHPTAPRKEMSSKRIAYAFLRRRGRRGRTEVLLEQRSPHASLMAGMWELPQTGSTEEERLMLNVRHSITTTNYYVSVLHFLPDEQPLLPQATSPRKWVRTGRLPGLPLTGLARKVLKRLHVLPGYEPGAVPVHLDTEESEQSASSIAE
jgi:A/G-specific adenine glycosylase